jgi:hypothetical protein
MPAANKPKQHMLLMRGQWQAVQGLRHATNWSAKVAHVVQRGARSTAKRGSASTDVNWPPNECGACP